MEGFEFLQELYIPIVMAVCLILGYILKHWIKDCDNKIIPTVLAVSGAVLACVNEWSITLELIASGAITGLSATGLHQMFKGWVEKKNV